MRRVFLTELTSIEKRESKYMILAVAANAIWRNGYPESEEYVYTQLIIDDSLPSYLHHIHLQISQAD